MLAHHVDGLLVAPVSDQSRSPLRQIIRQALPVVLVDRFVPDLRCDVVRGDSYLGAQLLVRHLLEVGHERIGLIAGPSNVSTARDRTLGFRETLPRRVSPSTSRLSFRPTASTRRAAASRWTSFSRAPRAPDRRFSPGTTSSPRARLQAIRASGRSVPEDIAVVCFDDNDYAAIVYPFLTVVATPAETFGTIATQLLLERIAGRAPERPRVVILPPELIVRVSCGANLARQATRAPAGRRACLKHLLTDRLGGGSYGRPAIVRPPVFQGGSVVIRFSASG